MAKTRLTQAQRKQLRKYLFKYLQKVDTSLDIMKFKEFYLKDCQNKLDKFLTLYYGDEVFIKQDWLHHVLHCTEQAYIYLSDCDVKSINDLEIDLSLRCDSSIRIPNTWRGGIPQNDPKYKESMTILTYVQEKLKDLKYFDIYKLACTNFKTKFYSLANPFVKLIQESKYCEDLYKIWDDSEVYKILFPQKTYTLSAISTQDIDTIKALVKKAKQNENKKAN